MTDRDEACLIDQSAEVERRIAAARPLPRSERAGFLAEIHAAVDAEARLKERAAPPDATLYRASLAKWQVLHRWLHRQPWRDRAGLKRSALWREALGLLRETRDAELIDWLALQISVWSNLEAGVQDMRPRDPAPSWLVALEYVANRKRKALALLHWAEAAEKEGCFTVDSNWHARSSRILGGEPSSFGRGSAGHEGIPWPDEEEG